MADRLWWAYGVVAMPTSVSAELRGIEGERVELVEAGALAALASPVPAGPYSGPALEERLNDLETLGRMAREHEAVLERALDGDVVPLRMCTLFATQDALRDMLVTQQERLLSALQRIHDAIELGVKAYVSPTRRAEPVRPASGKEYLALRLAQRDQQTAADASLERAAAALHAQLTDRAAAAVLLRPQDRRLSGRQEDMLLNGAYLVRRPEAPEFARLVESLGRGGELALEMTGPWPPYHFAEAAT
jgi:Gas vesicle synthesis protein GvpL/GvpF